MQTFLPYPSFTLCARALDSRRLCKQRVEGYQIARALLGLSKGWRRHPATLMWDGYEAALLDYTYRCCAEWKKRGFKDTITGKLEDLARTYDIRYSKAKEGRLPPWQGDERLHSSHRAALLHKMPLWYAQYGWTEEPKLDYFWP